MPSERKLLGTGNRLLDFSAVEDDEFLQNYNIKWNSAILQENRHFPMHDELASKHNLEYIAGGSTEDTNKAAQWMLQFPSSNSLTVTSGKKRRKMLKQKV